MRARRRTALAATLVASVALSSCTGLGSGGDPQQFPTGSGGASQGSASAEPSDATGAAAQVATEYLRNWSAGQDAAAAALTSDPVRAVQLLSGTRDNLRVTRLTATPGRPRPGADGSVDVPAAVVAELGGLGRATWQVTLHVVDAAAATNPATTAPATTGSTAAGATPSVPAAAATAPAGPATGPVVQFQRTIVHPGLTDTLRLGVVRTAAPRASILDRDGKPLTVQQGLYTVGVQPSQLKDPAAAYALLAELPNHPDVAALAKAVAAAQPDAFVPASTTVLRESEFAPFRTRLEAVPGVKYRDATTTLTPTSGFARSVLGRMQLASTVSPQRRAALGTLVSDTDYVGVGGLQQSAQTQLAGTPGGELVLEPRTGGDPVTVLQRFAGKVGTPLRSTLSLSVQKAAEAALAREPRAGALVAVQASTGQLLAVADQGLAADRLDGRSRALNTRYPPGSTFKVIDSTALLTGGLSLDAPVPCTPSIRVNGQDFTNVDGERTGTLPFRANFANSCNTAFISLRPRIPPATLPATAALFGLGADWTLGATSFSGSVPTPASPNEEAAALIGQGRVEMSPLAMAVVAATVASGRAHTPTLVTGTGRPPVVPDPAGPPANVAKGLRTLMAAAVSSGTATALRGVADGAKTGTAEFGTGAPLHTHSWMIAYSGDVAVCVLIEDGSTGAETAGPIVKRFLQSID